jgi:cell cycle protein kinase DBF2
MAGNLHPLSPCENREMRLPIPPPPLLTRSSNDYFDNPSAPTRHGFASPQQTPQGSPSKNVVPPGAYDLPNVFDNVMKLQAMMSGSPTRNARQQLVETSPQRNSMLVVEDTFAVDLPGYGQAAMPGSPTRKSNKENTPPGIRPALKKDSSFLGHAAQSRQGVYKTREAAETRTQYIQRGLSAEDIEKLQKPSVKRLANVTQLCKCCHGN